MNSHFPLTLQIPRRAAKASRTRVGQFARPLNVALAPRKLSRTNPTGSSGKRCRLRRFNGTSKEEFTRWNSMVMCFQQPGFVEPEMRKAFRRAVPLRTVVVYCYDPRAVSIPGRREGDAGAKYPRNS